jgi:hypothetical protein
VSKQQVNLRSRRTTPKVTRDCQVPKEPEASVREEVTDYKTSRDDQAVTSKTVYLQRPFKGAIRALREQANKLAGKQLNSTLNPRQFKANSQLSKDRDFMQPSKTVDNTFKGNSFESVRISQNQGLTPTLSRGLRLGNARHSVLTGYHQLDDSSLAGPSSVPLSVKQREGGRPQ